MLTRANPRSAGALSFALSLACASSACSSTPHEGAPKSSSGASAAASGSNTEPAASAPTGVTLESVGAARTQLTGESAPWLVSHGLGFVCTERVHPRPPSPHLTWWGWASPKSASEVFADLKRAFPDAAADVETSTLELTPAGSSRPVIVVGVAEISVVGGAVVYPEGLPICKEPLPPGTKSFVNVSEMPANPGTQP